MAPSEQPKRMRPSDIRYTQDSIRSSFRDGKPLEYTFEELLYGRISVDQLEWIKVVEERSLYWALTGNRRLYLYRMLEALGVLNTIPVRMISLSDPVERRRFDKRKTTSCDGLEIKLRPAQDESHFRSVIEGWKASKMANRKPNEGLAIYTPRYQPTDVPSYKDTSVDRKDDAPDVCNAEFAHSVASLLILLLVYFTSK